jgi:hypothetical protein
MAKLTYENDAGKQISFNIAESLITELEQHHAVDAWQEIFNILKEEIIATNKLAEGK